MGVVASAALGSSDMDPSGGAVGGSDESRGLDEGFDEDGVDVVLALPILGQALSGAGEDVGGEVGDADPGQDEEPCIVAQEREVFLAGLRGPSDEAVARRDFPCRGAEAEATGLARIIRNVKPSPAAAAARLAKRLRDRRVNPGEKRPDPRTKFCDILG